MARGAFGWSIWLLYIRQGNLQRHCPDKLAVTKESRTRTLDQSELSKPNYLTIQVSHLGEPRDRDVCEADLNQIIFQNSLRSIEVESISFMSVATRELFEHKYLSPTFGRGNALARSSAADALSLFGEACRVELESIRTAMSPAY